MDSDISVQISEFTRYRIDSEKSRYWYMDEHLAGLNGASVLQCVRLEPRVDRYRDLARRHDA